MHPPLRFRGAWLDPQGGRHPCACALMAQPAGAVYDADGQEMSSSSRRFLVRERQDVNPTWAFEFRGERHKIDSIEPFRNARRHGFLVVTADAAEGRVTRLGA